METQHGELSLSAYLANRSDYKAALNANKTKIHKDHYDRFKAFVYLKAVDQKKVGKLVLDLGNQFALGTDQFPKTVVKATEAVIAYRNCVNANGNTGGNGGGNRNRNSNNSNSNQSSNANMSFQQSPSTKFVPNQPRTQYNTNQSVWGG